MSRERIGMLVLLAYPRAARLGRGPEMLGMLLDAGGTSKAAFVRECGSLLIGGLRERGSTMTRRVRGRHLPLAMAATMAVIIALVAVTSSNPTSRVGGDRSSIRVIARELAPRLRPGDLVFLAQPDETTLARDYLPDGLQYATPFGANDYPGWLSQFAFGRADPPAQAVVARLIATLAPGQHLLFIRPVTETRVAWSSKWSRLVRRRAAQWGALLASDPELRVVAWAPRSVERPCCIAGALLYVKSSGPKSDSRRIDTDLGEQAQVNYPFVRHAECLRVDGFDIREYRTGDARLFTIQVGGLPTGPTVVFEPTAETADGLQMTAKAPATFVIGAALVHPNLASDAELTKVENCIATGTTA